MKRVLVPLAPGFEEIETVTLIDVLRRAEVGVTIAGTASGSLEGSRGIHMMADCLLDEADPVLFDMIALPGGTKGVEHLQRYPNFLSLLEDFAQQDKYIAAICAAPALLAANGLIRDRRATSHPSVRSGVNQVARYSEERVVVDKKIITSRGPGTAMEFALTLVEILVGVKKAEELREELLAASPAAPLKPQ